MQDREYWSADLRYGLRIPGAILSELFERCMAAGSEETGSILVGLYKQGNALAVVTKVPETPSDSSRGRTYFERGTRGLRALLHRLWRRKKQYYLGEWHYHPNASAEPSITDRRQMAEIALNGRYACPEPVLVVVGGAPGAWSLSARVFSEGKETDLEEASSE